MSIVFSTSADPRLCSMDTTTLQAEATSGFDVFEPDMDFDMESDIVDECGGLIDVFEEEDEEIPQRPSSRLGFHSLSPGSSSYAVLDLEDPSEAFPETMDWIQRSSNAAIGDGDIEVDSVDTTTTTTGVTYDMGEDIATVAPTDDLQDKYPGRLPPRSIVKLNATSQLDDVSNPFLLSDDESDCSDDESDGSSREDSDEDFEFSPTPFMPTSPSLRPPPYMPPFTAPVARPPLSPTQSIRPPMPTELPLPGQIRLPSPQPSYSNHGHSRHALHHLKCFWSMRESKWAERDAQIRDSQAYGGIADPSQHNHLNRPDLLRSATRRNLTQRFKPKSPPPRDSSALPPMSVHPRRGDLASLRDPYCMHMDRCFVNMPSWTLSKTLYMFDVHAGHEWQTRVTEMNKWKDYDGASASGPEATRKEPSCDTLDDVDLDSENESLGASASVASGDDSDATLVESENEGDVEQEGYSTFESFMSGTGPASPSNSSEKSHNTPRLKTSSASTSLSQKSSSKCPFPPSLYARIPSSTRHDTGAPAKPWATNWYRRWEILMDLVRFNWDQRQLFSALSVNERPYSINHPSCSTSRGVDVTCRKGKRRLRRQPRFYFDDESEDSDSWEWDSSFDWKNKAQISEPSFGLGVSALQGTIFL